MTLTRALVLLNVVLLALVSVCAIAPTRRATAQLGFECTGGHTITPGGISSIVGSGGTVVLTNWGGLDGQPQLNIYLNGVKTQGATSAVTGTGFSSTFGTLPAGTYDIEVMDGDCSSYSNEGGLAVTTSSTPSSIYPGALRGQYIATNALCSGSPCANGGTVTSWPDATSLHQDLTCTGGVTYVTADPGYLMPNIASVAFDGTSGYCTLATFALASTTNLAIMGAFYVPASGGGAGHTMVNVHGANDTNMTYDIVNNLDTIANGVTPGASVTSPTLNGVCTIDLSQNAFAGSTNTLTSSVNNLTPVTVGKSGTTWTSTSNLYVGAAYLGTSGWTAMHAAELFVVNTTTTTGGSSQLMSTVQYFNGRYGCTPFPTLVYNTGGQTSNSSCGISFSGTNFASGMTVSLGGGVGALTLNVMDGTYAEATLPSVSTPGAYDVIFANPDGRTQTFASAVTIGPGTNPVCIMGQYVGFWWEGQNWSCPSGCTPGNGISQLGDLSGYNNVLTQATGADQPTVNSLADSNFGSKPSLASVALTTMAGNLTFPSGFTATASETIAVLKQSATTGDQRLDKWSTGSPVFRSGVSNNPSAGAGVPNFIYNDGSTVHQAIWGSAMSGTSLFYGGVYGTGTVTTFVDLNDDGVSAVTATSSGTPVYYNSSTPAYQFPYNGGNGPLATVAAELHLFAHPTTAQAKALCNYYKTDFTASWSCP